MTGRLTEEQRAELLAEIEELKERRLIARKDGRSGDSAIRARGLAGAAGITKLIAQRHLLIRQEDES